MTLLSVSCKDFFFTFGNFDCVVERFVEKYVDSLVEMLSVVFLPLQSTVCQRLCRLFCRQLWQTVVESYVVIYANYAFDNFVGIFVNSSAKKLIVNDVDNFCRSFFPRLESNYWPPSKKLEINFPFLFWYVSIYRDLENMCSALFR